ncbi:Heat shock 70 kDa protein [Taenia solium]|eukprot:TsM_001200800 transcript=TsM_001200800 gene=TsM_001200800
MKDLVLLEVTPLSLGTGVRGDMVSTVQVLVFEGERPRTSDNNLLGKFILSGISPAPRGVPQIEVTFSTNENGILHVSAVVKSSSNANSIKTTNYKCRLSEDDIERMLKDAEKFKREDEKERSRIAAKNDLMDYVYSTKSALEKREMKRKTMEGHRENALAMCEEVIK